MSTDSSASGAVVRTLLVSDLVGSTRLVEQLGDVGASDVFQLHDRVARDLLEEHGGREIDKTDGFLLLFERPVTAVHYALAYHRALARLSEERGVELTARVGIHLGEVVLAENPPEDVARGAKPLEVEGLAKPTAARLMSLAKGRQTLLTRGAFDLARRGAVGAGDAAELRWLAHGAYLLKGVDEPVRVYEVGVEGMAPLVPPEDSAKARRAGGEDVITGWRPAPGLTVPQRAHWVVEEKLGEGGFGEVWLAAHDKTHDRRVFKFCYDAKSLLSLQREITLFRLLKEELGDRDDISRILDWSFDQAPYFIESEYTEGGNLIEWAEQQGGLDRVPLATRLDLVIQAAEALAAAHSVGVLHKDVKPANVLITGAGDAPRVRLTDFGVGRVTDRERLAGAGITVLGMTELVEPTPDTTRPTASSMSGTRRYMAPELLEGKPATVQADVYALGLVLYQLVVGDLQRVMAPGWRRDVDDELMREDIAAAVDRSPENRLSSASQLAERLRSLEERRQRQEAERRQRLEAQQAQAALERARKRRTLIAVVAAVLALFAGAMAYQARRVAREAERANREAEAARRVADFLAGLFSASDPFALEPVKPDQVTARELLERGAEQVDEELRDQPEVRARLMNVIGEVYLNIGSYDVARGLIESALAQRRELFGDEHLDVAESLHAMAGLFYGQGDYDAAEPLDRQALDIRRRLLGGEHPDVAASMQRLGRVLKAKGDYPAAEPILTEALALRRRLLGEQHPDLAESLNALAGLKKILGDFATAEPLYREALAIDRRRFGRTHPGLATSLNNLADMLQDTGDYEAAEPLYRESLGMLRELVGDEHPFVAFSTNNLATLLQYQEKYEAAEALFQESLALRRKLWGDDHPSTATGLHNLSALLRARGDPAAAQPLARQALATRRRLLGDEHAHVAGSSRNVADILLDLGDPSAAEPLARDAASIYRQALSEGHWAASTADSSLGAALAGLGRFAEAEPLLLAAYPVLRDETGERSPYTRDVVGRLVALYEAWGREDEAAKYRPLQEK